jgi:hypothetical protein
MVRAIGMIARIGVSSPLSVLSRRRGRMSFRVRLQMVRWVAVMVAAIVCSVANATHVMIAEVPANWRLENYPGNAVAVWYTPSPCLSGGLTFPSTTTSADQNRFWATVLAAKLSGRKMFVYYENANAPSTCPIVSFGMDNG